MTLNASPNEHLSAWVSVTRASVRAGPTRSAPVIGFLDRGSAVALERCTPRCDDKEGWALMVPRGAVHLSVLTFSPPAHSRENKPLLYGKVRSKRVTAYEQPSTAARVVASKNFGDSLAFFADSHVPAGWLEWVGEGFVPASAVQLFRPSPFAGEIDPVLPLAFITRRVQPRGPWLSGALQRFDRLTVLDARNGNVDLLVGRVPRTHVRIAFSHPRPSSIPVGAKWVHVDLTEQVLTAYEGDRPVFATLVSTGKPGFATRQGVYRVWLKMAHGRMRGRREPYDVEEVPSVLYFHDSEALHGTFWHDRFGGTASHGCVNLSLKDAEWVFAWAPPQLPEGWHTVVPSPKDEALYVAVERGPTQSFEGPLQVLPAL